MAQKCPKIAGLCRDIIDKYSIGQVEWHEFEMYRKVWSSTIFSITSPQTRLGENGKTISVVPLINGFYLYMDLAFSSPQNRTVKSLSLQFYDAEMMLFRADWTEGEVTNTKHAQPHWHFNNKSNTCAKSDPSANNVSFEKFGDFHSFAEDKTGKVDNNNNLNRLHFFMSYRDNSASLDFQNEKVLKDWLTYTLDYVDSQLKNIENHGQ